MKMVGVVLVVVLLVVVAMVLSVGKWRSEEEDKARCFC